MYHALLTPIVSASHAVPSRVSSRIHIDWHRDRSSSTMARIPSATRDTTRWSQSMPHLRPETQCIDLAILYILSCQCTEAVATCKNVTLNVWPRSMHTLLLSRWKRQKGDPVTPDKYRSCSTRSWQGQIKVWRRTLHKWDPQIDDTSALFTAEEAALCEL